MQSPTTPDSQLATLRWLHLSDLHVGMSDQDWLWPTLKHAFYEDMETLIRVVGAIDLVIFSGDLVQRGVPEEFDQFENIVIELWEKFKTWGSSPKLIVLPGNHDLQRAATLSPELRLLRRWWDEPEIHREFFSADNDPYRNAAVGLFNEYAKWVGRDQPAVPILRGNVGSPTG